MSVMGYLAVAKPLKKSKIRIESKMNVLHYKITTIIIGFCALFVGAKEFFGSPIMCQTKSKTIKGLINTYCLIMNTFSIPKNRSYVNAGIQAYHGTGTFDHEDQELTVHSYYLWVPLVLTIQAGLFYFPHFLWKKLGTNVFGSIMNGLDKFSMDYSSKEKKVKDVVKYMNHYLHTNNVFVAKFFICESLNLVNVVLNLMFMNAFFGGNFYSYGTDVLSYPQLDDEHRSDPMTRLFPKMAKCTFRKFGPSGTIETHDAFCLLATNIINEKIYIFLWFWLIGLTILTCFWLVFRIVTFFSSALRKRMLQGKARWAAEQDIDLIIESCSLGDWFLISQMGSQMEPMVFGDFVREFAKTLRTSAPTLERKQLLDNQ